MPFIELNGARYHYTRVGDGPALLLLHGFTGSAANWARHADLFAAHYDVIALDLLGHGRSAVPLAPARYAMGAVMADLDALLARLTEGRAHVLGYSMGGRLALGFALTYPWRLHRLVLESASPGLETTAERAARVAQDEALAARIEADGVPAFVDYWTTLPLFTSQARLAPPARRALRAQRLRNRAPGLANSLRGMGTGAQPCFWDALRGLKAPLLLLTGAEDEKFARLARRMARLAPGSRHEVIPNAGHTIHLEQPRAYARAVLAFLAGEGGAGRSRSSPE